MSRIEISNPIPRYQENNFKKPVNLIIENGENAVIIGPNGAGKTLLTNYINGAVAIKGGTVSVTDAAGYDVPHSSISTLSFKDIYRFSGISESYYQQRWNTTDTDDCPLVQDLLGAAGVKKFRSQLTDLKIRELLKKRLIFLSSGELRKLLIFRSIMTEPKLLIIDNPYIGLDAESRTLVNNILCDISNTLNVQILLVISHPKDMPNWIDSVIPVSDMEVLQKMTRKDFLEDKNLISNIFKEINTEKITLPEYLGVNENADYENAVVMNKVSIDYGKIPILHELSWKVKRGEKWALLGKNGSGKSTLLSLICGDNPQGYANDITLFDRKRGTGESIWEIKSHIGYISPDMHTYYMEDIPCIDVVASGYFDTIGLYRKPNDAQIENAKKWMRTFNAEHLADKSFLRISYGEQRLVLLIRVFVKQPSLIVLDEPLHGLDAGKKNLAKIIIEEYCKNSRVTLIYVTHYKEEIPSVIDKEITLIKNE